MSNHEKQLKLARNYETKQANEKLQLAKKLGTRIGFFEFYFNNLPNFKTQTDCFYAVNELHFSIFSEYKYSDYNSFRKQVTTYLKPKK